MQPATKYRITLFFPFSIRCRAFRMPFPLAKHIFKCIYSLQNVRRAFLTLYCYFTVQRTLCMLQNIAHVKFTSTPISIYFPTDFKWQHLHKYSQRSYIIVAYSRPMTCLFTFWLHCRKASNRRRKIYYTENIENRNASWAREDWNKVLITLHLHISTLTHSTISKLYTVSIVQMILHDSHSTTNDKWQCWF